MPRKLYRIHRQPVFLCKIFNKTGCRFAQTGYSISRNRIVLPIIMATPFDTHWAEKARLAFNQLPTEVQNAFLRQLPNLVASYASLYAQRPEDSKVVGTVSHMQAPDWNLWLRMGTEYAEAETGPILFVNEFSSLSPADFEQSVAAARQSANLH
jgi:hypothetical protein